MPAAPSLAFRVIDLVLALFVLPAAALLKLVRRIGVKRLPVCRSIFFGVGVFPIRDHYYEPQFDNRNMRRPPSQDRPLPGVDWNEAGQLSFLDKLTYADELRALPRQRDASGGFHLDNGAFESGDAEYLYQVIRATKPRRIFEIGSGHSTLIAKMALDRNRADDPGYGCRHVCIEPYEMPWLEGAGVEVMRQKAEDVDLAFFAELDTDDLLFIDSSHMIRPGGDVLFEYLELLPTIRPGVLVHIHDIFSPKDYLRAWLVDEVRLWNEQYLLEAFLTENDKWEVLGAVNYLQHHHHDRLRAVAPFLTPDREPGSFYIRKVG